MSKMGAKFIQTMCINCELQPAVTTLSGLCAACATLEDNYYEEKEEEAAMKEIEDNPEDYDGVLPLCMCGEPTCDVCEYFASETREDDVPF